MTDTPKEKTLTEMENEARTRAEAELKKTTPKSEKKAGQSEVSALKKDKKNHIMTLSLLLMAGLLVMAWTADRVMQHYLHPQQAKEETDKPAESTSVVHKRTGMGMDTGALTEPETVQNVATSATPQPSTSQPAVLNKSLALAVTQNGESQKSGQGSVLTRKAEQEQTTSKAAPASGANTSSGVTTEQQASATIQRITLDPDLYIPADTYIPCTLQTRFVSDVAGHISCIISEDVYSASEHVRLIQAGTRARGMYKTGMIKQGQSRMFVIWTELRTPDGLKIPMVDSQVVGQLGEAGIDGWIDSHFWERAGNTLLVSMVPDLAAAAANNAPGKDRNTDYTENTRAGVAEIAKSMMENSVNIPPTIYKNQGDIIGMMTGEDIDFSGVYKLAYKGDQQ